MATLSSTEEKLLYLITIVCITVTLFVFNYKWDILYHPFFRRCSYMYSTFVIYISVRNAVKFYGKELNVYSLNPTALTSRLDTIIIAIYK
jgi:hypothetical protein